MLGACRAQLVQQDVREEDITLATVPGALEIPLVLQRMAQSGKFDALIALGAVIRGDTYHFEVVSNESARCVGEVQLHTGVPIANAIMTTDTDEQAIARMHVKGSEAALVAIEMVNLLRAWHEYEQGQWCWRSQKTPEQKSAPSRPRTCVARHLSMAHHRG